MCARKRILLGLITLCFVVLCGFGVQSKQTKRAGKNCWKAPAWFDTKDCGSTVKPQVLSTGEFGPNGTVICRNTFLFCGYELSKSTTLPDNSGTGGHCPTSDDFSLPDICCAKLAQAVKSKQPCDPQIDANCDGIPNAADPDPLYNGPPQDGCDCCAEVQELKDHVKALEDRLKALEDKLNGADITLGSGDNSVQISHENGITIRSNHDITIKSDMNVVIKGRKIIQN